MADHLIHSSVLEAQSLDDLTLAFLSEPLFLLQDDFVMDSNVSLLILPPIVLIWRDSIVEVPGFYEMDWEFPIH
jgi:hypothetical protein